MFDHRYHFFVLFASRTMFRYLLLSSPQLSPCSSVDCLHAPVQNYPWLIKCPSSLSMNFSKLGLWRNLGQWGTRRDLTGAFTSSPRETILLLDMWYLEISPILPIRLRVKSICRERENQENLSEMELECMDHVTPETHITAGLLLCRPVNVLLYGNLSWVFSYW